MIYELRIYRCVPGRKPALLSRFENETLRIWEKHGIRQAGFWTTLIGKSSQEITWHRALEFGPEQLEIDHRGQPLEVVPLLRQHREPLLDVEHADLPCHPILPTTRVVVDQISAASPRFLEVSSCHY
jgi:hypothetical protein